MEESSSNIPNDVEEQWNDASDEFPFVDSSDSIAGEESAPEPLRKSLRRRRLIPHGSTRGVELGSILGNYSKFKDRKLKASRSFVDNEKIIDNDSENLESTNVNSGNVEILEGVNEEKEEISEITNENIEETSDSVGHGLDVGESDNRFEENYSDSRENEGANSSMLLFCVNMLIKSITFQLSLLISIVTFPVWFIYTSYMFLVDPFGLMRRGKSYVIGKALRMCGVVSGNLSPFLYKWLKEHDSVWKLGLKCVWGVLWSGYACIILVLLLVMAFVMGGLVVKGVVEEPLRIKEILNFDYTEKSPVAYVQLEVHPMGDRLVEYKENVEELSNFDGGRLIGPNQNLQVTISLKMPESEYNRNLGNFQVKVDLLSADGKTLASSRRPCILRFRSDIIRFILTFLKVAPLITGYASESQTMNIHFKGFTEGTRPTTCLKVIIEQRAEFQPGGGIPEIYSASLALESELPLLKRVMWYWKKTLFVWISMTLFTVELCFALLCCKPLVIPRIKLRENSANRNAAGVNTLVQQ